MAARRENLLEAVRRGIGRAPGSGRPEAILREEVQPALAELLATGGLRSAARDEMRLAVPAPADAHELDAPIVTFGRADAIYNRFVIEFEPPGSLRPSLLHSATRHAVSQVQQYLRGLSEHGHLPLERLAGCAFDGSWIIYVSFDAGDWQVSRPRSVDLDALAGLVATLESLSSGRGLTAENLAEDFGPESSVARGLVPALTAVLDPATTTDRARAFFEQWKLDLGNASGLPSDLDLPDWLELCEMLGVSAEVRRQPHVLFALQTYFGIVAKLICVVVLGGATKRDLMAGLTQEDDIWRGYEALESGSLTASTGAVNAIEPGLFSWYLGSRTPEVAAALRRVAEVAAEYSAEVVEITPLRARDLMKDLFQTLLPRSLRHRLGEYYTPDWLAEYVLDQVSYNGDPSKTLLDPACGSGTFLVAAIGRVRAWFQTHRNESDLEEPELLRRIARSITGFDLSPLAVMSARTNYLIAIRDLLSEDVSIEIPVYLCDSVLTPVEYGDLFTGGLGKALELKTSAGVFLIPKEVVQRRDIMASYSRILQHSAEQDDDEDTFVSVLRASCIPASEEELHRQLYRQVVELAKGDKDGIWANIIRNSFAPLFHERVDYVVGNPPWVFWNTLPPQYRDEVKRIMVDVYGLAAGSESTMRRLGSAGKDLSALFVYVSLDRYIKDAGRLGFVITQTLFQSTAATEFRKWKLPGGVDVGVEAVDDWVKVAPFASAGNKTATFVAIRGKETKYPVRYRIWEPKGRFDRNSASLDVVRSQTTVRNAWAHPADPRKPGSLWVISASQASLSAAASRGNYRPRLGVETKLEAVFRVRVTASTASGRLLVENIRDRAKILVPGVHAEIEPDLVYPYVTGASIGKWTISSPGNYIVPHTAETGIRPIAETTMTTRFPFTYAYLKRFRSELENRSLHKRWGKGNEFYSMYDIGPYTFSPYKVVWKRTTKNFEACVASSLPVAGDRTALVIPNGKVMMIPLVDREEAHYVCAVLNSTLARSVINGAISSEAHAELLDLITLPKFDPSKSVHSGLAEQSMACHLAVIRDAAQEVSAAEAAIDDLVVRL
jgi:N-6 DNA Methylase